MARRSQKIKKSVTTFFNYTKEGESKFKVNSYLVNFERNINENDNNIPSCSCNNYDVNTFCEHVYYILLFIFKVNIRNRILRKNKFTDSELENIFLKQYRSVSIRRVPRVRLQRRIRPQPPARRRIIVRRAPARNRIVRQPLGRLSRNLQQNVRYRPHPPSHPRPPSRRPNRNSVYNRRRRFIDVLASSYRNNESGEAGRPAIPILVPDENPLDNLRQRFENIQRILRHSPRRVNLHIPRPRVFINPEQDGQNFPSPIRRISDIRHIANIAILNSPQRNITNEDKCSICLNRLNINCGIITRCSVCSNDFHNLCLDTWIVSKIREYTAPSCPLCRSRISLR
jgi:hypothetical protein